MWTYVLLLAAVCAGPYSAQSSPWLSTSLPLRGTSSSPAGAASSAARQRSRALLPTSLPSDTWDEGGAPAGAFHASMLGFAASAETLRQWVEELVVSRWVRDRTARDLHLHMVRGSGGTQA